MRKWNAIVGGALKFLFKITLTIKKFKAESLCFALNTQPD